MSAEVIKFPFNYPKLWPILKMDKYLLTKYSGSSILIHNKETEECMELIINDDFWKRNF